MSDEHWDHDLHGPVFEIARDGSVTVDPDCDCPPGCMDCDMEGVVRDPEVLS